MVIPVARTPREILEMQGQPVTLGNIGQTVINNATTPEVPVPGDNPSSFSSFINTFFSIAAKFILDGFRNDSDDLRHYRRHLPLDYGRIPRTPRRA